VAPNIVAFVPVKTVSFANVLRSRRSTWIGVYCLMPRVYMTPICRGWSREYCSSDQCRRSKFQPGHFQSPFNKRANGAWLVDGDGEETGSIKEHFITPLQPRAR
jgi:hypothetical protein